MTTITKLTLFGLLVLSGSAVVSMEKKIELTEQKTELPEKFENFNKLPKELKIEILKKHLEEYAKDPETLNQAIAELRTLSKEIKTIIDTDPLLKKHIEQLKDLAALNRLVEQYRWARGDMEKTIIDFYKKFKNYKTSIKGNKQLVEMLKNKISPARQFLKKSVDIKFKNDELTTASQFIIDMLNL